MPFPRRWRTALLVALAFDVVLAMLGGIDEVQRLFRGDHDVRTVLTVAGFAAQGAVLLVTAVVLGSLLTAHKDLFRRSQALDATDKTSRDWLWETDTEGRVTYSNAGVTDLLGYRPEDVLGRDVRSLIQADARPAGDALRRAALSGGDGWSDVELTWLHADGSAVVLRGSAAVITDERREIVGLRGSRRRVSDEELAERRVEETRLRLTSALEAGALDIALQPIVEFGTGRIAGVEALSRFRDGRSPDAWFTEAADNGMALELDRLAFLKALDVLPELPDGCYLSVNATPELLLAPDLLTQLTSRALTLDRLVIEITEHSRIVDYDELLAALAPIRERGVRLAIDDTGAGYASLSHVLKLSPSIIKIDRSLITNISADAARRSLVTAIVLLALDLGASVTGEGIETPGELETLASLGVDLGQGYLLARPSLDRATWSGWWQRNWLYPQAQATAQLH